MGKDSGIFERRPVSAGTMIVKEGDPANCAYLIQSGKVVVFTEADERPVELARLGVGEIFGEMALGSDMPRSASVKALEDTSLIIITRDMLQKKLERSDSTVQAIFKMLVKRMAQTNKAVVQKKTNVSELVETTKETYKHIYSTLPASKQKTFERGVRPSLEEFLSAIEAFNQRYSK